MANKSIKVNRYRRIHHISDKIYVNASGEVTGVYPAAKQTKSSTLFRFAFRKVFKNMIKRLLIWLGASMILGIIGSLLMRPYPIIGGTLKGFAVCLMLFITVCYVLSFRYEMMSVIGYTDMGKLVGMINKTAESIKVEEADSVNLEKYRELDAISQIVDLEKVRNKKLMILSRFVGKTDYENTMETDSILLNNSNPELTNYINKLNDINYGPITALYFNENKKG